MLFNVKVFIQGALKMLESELTVISRPKDDAIVKNAVEGAKKQYHEISGRTVEITIDQSLGDSG
jgi:V-type H+-transporting ATPase subunit E